MSPFAAVQAVAKSSVVADLLPPKSKASQLRLSGCKRQRKDEVPLQPSPNEPIPNSAATNTVDVDEEAARLAKRQATCRVNRARAIAKFKHKRAQRTFDKRVRYVSRKRLAESRPRVRGQFVKANTATLLVDSAVGAHPPQLTNIVAAA